MTVSIEKTLARLDQLTKEESSAFYQQLSEHINWMINNRFEELVQVLYRLDVDEKKLKILLSESEDKNAADIITSLIIERQLQKLKHENNKAPIRAFRKTKVGNHGSPIDQYCLALSNNCLLFRAAFVKSYLSYQFPGSFQALFFYNPFKEYL